MKGGAGATSILPCDALHYQRTSPTSSYLLSLIDTCHLASLAISLSALCASALPAFMCPCIVPQGVLHWGEVAGYAWRADRTGPGGITPLHLAALQVSLSESSVTAHHLCARQTHQLTSVAPNLCPCKMHGHE